MKLSAWLAFLFVGVLSTSTLTQPTDFPPELGAQGILKRPIERVELHDSTLADAFMLILRHAGVPGGIRLVKAHNSEKKTEIIVPKGASLEEAMRILVSVDERYNWLIDDGVLNLVPKRKSETLLDARVAYFECVDATNVFACLQQLLQTPQIRKRAAELGLEEAFVELGFSSIHKTKSEQAPPLRPLKVRCQGVSLREALNKIVEADGHAVWMYEEFQARKKKFFRIGFPSR